MKFTSTVISLLTMFAAASQGAITISGTLGSLFKTDDLSTNIPSGALVMLVVDNGSNGFLNLSSSGSVAPSLTGQSGKTITVAQAGTLTAGSSFGGDTVLSTTTAGGSGSIAGLLNAVDITSFVNRNFAVVYFTDTAANLSGNLANQFFGMIRLSDWTLPASDAGQTFTLSSTDASGPGSYYSVSSAITSLQMTGGFFTGSGIAGDVTDDIKGSTFQIIPEPSAALLGAVGALCLLRRRRI